LPDFPKEATVMTSDKLLDYRGHITEGLLIPRDSDQKIQVILKRKPPLANCAGDKRNDRKCLYGFINIVKKKLRELAAIEENPMLSDEEKQQRIREARLDRDYFMGVAHIVPIVGTVKCHHTHPETSQTETEIIEISPKIEGHSLGECTKKKLPPFDTPSGLPRNQEIAVDLLLYFANVFLTIDLCRYVAGDCNLGNVMIVQNGAHFSCKFIDWEYLVPFESARRAWAEAIVNVMRHLLLPHPSKWKILVK
jgi:hypothetical protein